MATAKVRLSVIYMRICATKVPLTVPLAAKCGKEKMKNRSKFNDSPCQEGFFELHSLPILKSLHGAFRLLKLETQQHILDQC